MASFWAVFSWADNYQSQLFEAVDLIYDEKFETDGPHVMPEQWEIRQSTQWNVKNGILHGGVATEEFQKMKQAKKSHHDGTRPVIMLKPVPKSFVLRMRARYSGNPAKSRKQSQLDLGHHINTFFFHEDKTVLVLQREKEITIEGELFPPNEWAEVTIEIKEGEIFIKANDRQEVIRDKKITLKTDEPTQQVDFKGLFYGTIEIDWLKLYEPKFCGNR